MRLACLMDWTWAMSCVVGLLVWIDGCRVLICLEQVLKVCFRFIGCIRSATSSLLQVNLVLICGEWLYAVWKYLSVAIYYAHDML